MIDIIVVAVLDGIDRRDIPKKGALKTLQLSRVLVF